MSKVGLVVLILGLLGVLLGGGVLLVSLLLPVLTDGRTSWDEAMLGIIPGALLLTLSLVVAAAGAVVLIVKRKKQPNPAAAGR
jgi:Na+-transporting NADH:ubiquinone oxidoreductase subunit NqrB